LPLLVVSGGGSSPAGGLSCANILAPGAALQDHRDEVRVRARLSARDVKPLSTTRILTFGTVPCQGTTFSRAVKVGAKRLPWFGRNRVPVSGTLSRPNPRPSEFDRITPGVFCWQT
jgi:hypothetical protein